MWDRALPDHELVSRLGTRCETGALEARDSHATALTAARAALEKHAEGVVILDLRTLSTIADFFIVCTAASSRQIAALTDHIEAVLARHGARVWHTEGTPASTAAASGPHPAPQWVLMDCGEIVIHILDEVGRRFYRLEELWADAPRLPLPHA